MIPLSTLATQKFSALLLQSNGLQSALAGLETEAKISLPPIATAQIVVSSAAQDIADKNVQLTYPRISLYSEKIKNLQTEKFRTFSGTVSVVAEVWSSANLVQQNDLWLQYYVEAVTSLLRQRIGDWGDGLFFSGMYEVQFQPSKAGGFGFVQSAKVSCNFNVSRN